MTDHPVKSKFKIQTKKDTYTLSQQSNSVQIIRPLRKAFEHSALYGHLEDLVRGDTRETRIRSLQSIDVELWAKENEDFVFEYSKYILKQLSDTFFERGGLEFRKRVGITLTNFGLSLATILKQNSCRSTSKSSINSSEINLNSNTYFEWIFSKLDSNTNDEKKILILASLGDAIDMDTADKKSTGVLEYRQLTENLTRIYENVRSEEVFVILTHILISIMTRRPDAVKPYYTDILDIIIGWNLDSCNSVLSQETIKMEVVDFTYRVLRLRVVSAFYHTPGAILDFVYDILSQFLEDMEVLVNTECGNKNGKGSSSIHLIPYQDRKKLKVEILEGLVRASSLTRIYGTIVANFSDAPSAPEQLIKESQIQNHVTRLLNVYSGIVNLTVVDATFLAGKVLFVVGMWIGILKEKGYLLLWPSLNAFIAKSHFWSATCTYLSSQANGAQPLQPFDVHLKSLWDSKNQISPLVNHTFWLIGECLTAFGEFLVSTEFLNKLSWILNVVTESKYSTPRAQDNPYKGIKRNSPEPEKEHNVGAVVNVFALLESNQAFAGSECICGPRCVDQIPVLYGKIVLGLDRYLADISMKTLNYLLVSIRSKIKRLTALLLQRNPSLSFSGENKELSYLLNNLTYYLYIVAHIFRGFDIRSLPNLAFQKNGLEIFSTLLYHTSPRCKMTFGPILAFDPKEEAKNLELSLISKEFPWLVDKMIMTFSSYWKGQNYSCQTANCDILNIYIHLLCDEQSNQELKIYVLGLLASFCSHFSKAKALLEDPSFFTSIKILVYVLCKQILHRSYPSDVYCLKTLLNALTLIRNGKDIAALITFLGVYVVCWQNGCENSLECVSNLKSQIISSLPHMPFFIKCFAEIRYAKLCSYFSSDNLQIILEDGELARDLEIQMKSSFTERLYFVKDHNSNSCNLDDFGLGQMDLFFKFLSNECDFSHLRNVYLQTNPPIDGSRDSSEYSAIITWFGTKSAQLCFGNKLKTGWGKPSETLTHIENFLKKFIELTTVEKEYAANDPKVLEICGQWINANHRVLAFITFLERLEQLISDTIEGRKLKDRLHLYQTDPSLLPFYLNNQGVCTEWFVRIKMACIGWYHYVGYDQLCSKHASLFLINQLKPVPGFARGSKEMLISINYVTTTNLKEKGLENVCKAICCLVASSATLSRDHVIVGLRDWLIANRHFFKSAAPLLNLTPFLNLFVGGGGDCEGANISPWDIFGISLLRSRQNYEMCISHATHQLFRTLSLINDKDPDSHLTSVLSRLSIRSDEKQPDFKKVGKVVKIQSSRSVNEVVGVGSGGIKILENKRAFDITHYPPAYLTIHVYHLFHEIEECFWCLRDFESYASWRNELLAAIQDNYGESSANTYKGLSSSLAGKLDANIVWKLLETYKSKRFGPWIRPRDKCLKVDVLIHSLRESLANPMLLGTMLKINIYDPEFNVKFPNFVRASKESILEKKRLTDSKGSTLSLRTVKNVIQILAKEKSISPDVQQSSDHADIESSDHSNKLEIALLNGEDLTKLAVYHFISQTILGSTEKKELTGDMLLYLSNQEWDEKCIGKDYGLRVFICSYVRQIRSLPLNIDTFTIHKPFLNAVGLGSIGQRTLCGAYIKTQNFGSFSKLTSRQNSAVADWSMVASNRYDFWPELTNSIRSYVIDLKLTQPIGQSDLTEINNLLDSIEYVYCLNKDKASDSLIQENIYQNFMEILCIFVPKLLPQLLSSKDTADFKGVLPRILARALVFVFKTYAALPENSKLNENSSNTSALVEVLTNWLVLNGVKELCKLRKEATYNLPFVVYRCVKTLNRYINQPNLEQSFDPEFMIYKDLYRDFMIQFGNYAYSLSFKNLKDITKNDVYNLNDWAMVQEEWSKVFAENGFNASSQALSQFEEEFMAVFLTLLKLPAREMVLQDAFIAKLWAKFQDLNHTSSSIPLQEFIVKTGGHFEVLAKSLFAHHSIFLDVSRELYLDEEQRPTKAYLVIFLSRLINLLLLNTPVLELQLKDLLTSIPLKYLEDFIPILLSIYKMTSDISTQNLSFVALQRFCQDPSYSVALIYSVLPDILNFEDLKDQTATSSHDSNLSHNDPLGRIEKLYRLLKHGNNAMVELIKSFVSALRYFALPLEQAWINGLQMYQNDFKRRHSHLVKALENFVFKMVPGEKSVHKKLSFKTEERTKGQRERAHKFHGLEEIMIEHIKPIQRTLTYMVHVTELRSSQASTGKRDLEFWNQFSPKIAEIHAEFDALFLQIEKIRDKDLELDVLKDLLASLDTPFTRTSAVFAEMLERYQGRKNSKLPLAKVCPDLLTIVKDAKVLGGIPLITRDDQNDIQIINIMDIDPVVIVLQTKTKPKKLTFTIDDGSKHEYLLKAHEDLQLDHKVLQFNLMSDRLFSSLFNDETRYSTLIKSYQVIPISDRAGLIQMVRGTGKHILPLYGLYKTWLLSNAPPAVIHSSAPILEQILPAHSGSEERLSNPSLPDLGSDYNRNFPAFESAVTGPTTPGVVGGKVRKAEVLQPRQPIEMYYEKLQPALVEAGLMNKDVLSTSSPVPPSSKQAANALTADRSSWPANLLNSVYQELLAQTPADGYLLWNELASQGSSNYTIERTFALTTALNSLVGYLLGLGDRHLGNLLVDFSTGSLIHIDFNVCFERGKYLKVPENVPFRMTPIIEMALGPLNGVEGTFRETVYEGMRALRQNCEILRAYSSWLLLDPPPEWYQDSGAGKFGRDSSSTGQVDKENALLDTLARYFLPTLPEFKPSSSGPACKIQKCNGAYWLSELKDSCTVAFNHLIGKHGTKWQFNENKILETLAHLVDNLKGSDLISSIMAKHGKQWKNYKNQGERIKNHPIKEPVENPFASEWNDIIIKCRNYEENLQNYKKTLNNSNLELLKKLEERILNEDNNFHDYSKELIQLLKPILPTYTLYFERLISSNPLYKLSQYMLDTPNGEKLTNDRLQDFGDLLKISEASKKPDVSTLASTWSYITKAQQECIELVTLTHGQNYHLDAIVLEIIDVTQSLDKSIALWDDTNSKIQPQVNGIKLLKEAEQLSSLSKLIQDFVVKFATKDLEELLLQFLRSPVALKDAFKLFIKEIFGQQIVLQSNVFSADNIYANLKARFIHIVETKHEGPSLQFVSLLENFEHFDVTLETLLNSMLGVRGFKDTTISIKNSWMSDKKNLFLLRLCTIKAIVEDISQSINDDFYIDIIEIYGRLIRNHFLPYCRRYINFMVDPIEKIIADEIKNVYKKLDLILNNDHEFFNASDNTNVYGQDSGPNISIANHNSRTKTVNEDLSKSLSEIIVEYTNFVMRREGISVQLEIDWAAQTLLASNDKNLDSLKSVITRVKCEINWENKDVPTLNKDEKDPQTTLEFLVYLSKVLIIFDSTISLSSTEFQSEFCQVFLKFKEAFLKAKDLPNGEILDTSIPIKRNEFPNLAKGTYKDKLNDNFNGSGMMDYLEGFKIKLRQTLVDLQNHIFSQIQIVSTLNHSFKQFNKLKLRMVDLGELFKNSTVLKILALLERSMWVYGVCMDFYKSHFTSLDSDCSLLVSQLKQASNALTTCNGPGNRLYGRSPERVKVVPKHRRKRNQSCDSKSHKMSEEEGGKKIILARKSVLSNVIISQQPNDSCDAIDENHLGLPFDLPQFLLVQFPIAKLKISKNAKMLRDALSLLYEMIPSAIKFLQSASLTADTPEDSAILEQKAVISTWCDNRLFLLNQLDLIGDKYSPVNAKKSEKCKTEFEAKRRRVAKYIIARMGDKLNGYDGDLLPYISSSFNSDEKNSPFPLTAQKQVDALIIQSKAKHNLATIYEGWMAWI